jgi:hypothetical protein
MTKPSKPETTAPAMSPAPPAPRRPPAWAERRPPRGFTPPRQMTPRQRGIRGRGR